MTNKDIKTLEEAYTKIMESLDDIEIIEDGDGNKIGEVYLIEIDDNGYEDWGCFHYKTEMDYGLIASKEKAIQLLKELEMENHESDDEDYDDDDLYFKDEIIYSKNKNIK